MPFLNLTLVDVDQTGTGDGSLGDVNHVAEITSRWDQSSDCQALAEGGAVEWEEGFERDGDLSVDIDLDVLEILDDWDVLLVDVDERQSRPIVVVSLPLRLDCVLARDVEAECNVLRLGLNTLGLDGERGVDDDVLGDLVEVGAGTWDNEHLVQSRESELSGTGSQEWELSGNQLLGLEICTEKTILLAFLTDN